MADKADPEAADALAAPEEGGRWRVGLFQCFEHAPLCMCSVFFQCFPLARQVSRAQLAPYGLAVGALVGVLTLASVCQSMTSAWDQEHRRFVADDAGFRVETDEPPPVWYGLVSALSLLIGVGMCALLVLVRVALVRKYAIKEAPVVSALAALCCPPCAIGQQALQVDLAEYGEVDQDCTLVGEHRKQRPVNEFSPVNPML